ncbi:MAG: T9SS type A sorting domain-containing protein [Bacteroidota bacterium]
MKFVSPPGTFTVTKTPLKYNKLFAFSCQLDDGASDIYTKGLPFLNGGKVGGTTYPGLKYTDGCGTDIKFKMSSSLYSFDASEKVDIHDPVSGNPSFVRWAQVNEMYQNGWGISNHGLSGNVGNFEYSVARNHSYVKLKTQAATTGGINMGIFVNPNGDPNFTQYAIQNGYRVCFREGISFGKPSFDVTSTWPPGQYEMGRTNFYTGINISTLADNMANASTGGAHHWGVAFSHSITNATFGYDFETFKSQMTDIANKYGKGGGDNIWMTTEEEVLNYIMLNPYLNVNTQISGNDLVISFAGNLPDDFRFYAVSLMVNSSAAIQSISIQGPGAITYNGAGTNESLINLSWDKNTLFTDSIDPAVMDAETWVSKTEVIRTQQYANIATDYVNILPAGIIKDGFRSRLCAIGGIIYPPYFCSLSVEEGFNGHLDIFPNPANEELNIKAGITIDKITLLSILGKIVHEKVVKSRDVQINVMGLHPGIYILKIDAGAHTSLRKIFVNS